MRCPGRSRERDSPAGLQGASLADESFVRDFSLALLVKWPDNGPAMGQHTLQHFELHVLLAMLRLGGDAYSVPLVLELEKRTGRQVAQAAVFITLGRLEKKGLVVSRMEEPETGRVRRYFKVTRQGLALVRDTREQHARLWHSMARVLRSHKA